MRIRLMTLTCCSALIALGCSDLPDSEVPAGDRAAEEGAPSAHDRFWNGLVTLCGLAFQGEASGAEAQERGFQDAELTVYLQDCMGDSVRAPITVGDDASRSWVLHRLPDGLGLRHHRRVDDAEKGPSRAYGGTTQDEGAATRQAFLADSASAELLGVDRPPVWQMEILPGRTLSYEVLGPEGEATLRLEFDLMRPVDPPSSEEDEAVSSTAP